MHVRLTFTVKQKLSNTFGKDNKEAIYLDLSTRNYKYLKSFYMNEKRLRKEYDMCESEYSDVC